VLAQATVKAPTRATKPSLGIQPHGLRNQRHTVGSLGRRDDDLPVALVGAAGAEDSGGTLHRWNLWSGCCVFLVGVVLEFEEITALYSAYGGELWRALLVVSAGRSDLAREATAEAFARLVVHHESVREPRGWLYRTGYRVVIDQLRREQRLSGEPHDVPIESIGLSGNLREALGLLSPAQRLAVFLTYEVGMSLREVADVTGSPVATVKVRLHRARKALRRALDEPEEADVRA
jgi:RNA polymerase sigma-70 factor (ECF subfamily)